MTQLGYLISNDVDAFTRTEKMAIGLPTYGCAYAGYILGADAWDGTPYSPIEDVTRHGRDLTVTGAFGDQAIVGPTNYADTPFNATDLAARTGKCTIVTVANTAPDVSANAWPVSNRISGSSGVEWIGIQQTATSFAARAMHRLNGSERDSNANFNAEDRSGFLFIAGSYSPEGTQVTVSRDGVALYTGSRDTTPLISAVGGSLPFRIGRSHSTGDGVTNVAAAFFFDDQLSPVQLADFLRYVTTLLLACTGVVVAGGTTITEAEAI